MQSVLRTAGAAFVWIGVAAATAQVPSQAEMQRELDSIYRVSSSTLELPKAGSQMDRRIQAVTIRQAGYLVGQLKAVEQTSGALSLTNNGSDEHSIRPNARIAGGLAMMVRGMKDEDFPTTLSRAKCREDAVKVLRFLLETHGAGGGKCANGKQWHDQWQSALWANSAGLAAWLLWDELDAPHRWMAARMICDEADRFVDLRPPAQVENDTKAEENAWNSTVVSLAACMFPSHPRHTEYVKTARRWAVASFVRPADVQSSETIDGKNLAQWDVGPTIHDDFTLENHNRVHPDYMNTINLKRDQWLPYMLGGLEFSDAFEFNNTGVYGALRSLTFPDAGYLYINGQDWQLHRNCHWFPTYLMQAIRERDAGAAMLADRALETAERMLDRTTTGGMFLPEEFSFPSTQTDALEMYALMRLAVARFGVPVAQQGEREYWEGLNGIHRFDAGSYALVRSPLGVATFSWGDQPMGMVVPLQKDLLWSPNERSLIGEISVAGLKKEQPKVIRSAQGSSEWGFSVCGEMERAGGAVTQRFAFVALLDGRTLYVDDIRVTKTVHDAQFRLGLVPVLNDTDWVWHDGNRRLFWDGGEETFDARNEKPVRTKELSSRWFNIDDKLGIVVDATSQRQIYHGNKTISNGRLEQPFVLNSVANAKEFQPSDEPIARTAIVFYPGLDNENTARLAKGVKFDWQGALCRIRLDDGAVVSADLAAGQAQYSVDDSQP